ncbi:MAG: Omp28 family outer membrane lipoprotein [Chitinophagales bacterium]|nr:Omp28 family outer membrane lipoprotein [Chitinophagales bacterium]
MKKLLSKIWLLAVLALAGCHELPPPLFGDDDDDVPPVQRKVLIEEFTGVTCVICPSGSAHIEELIEIHGEDLIPIAIHSGGFSDPFPESVYDFRTEDGTNILNFVGVTLGYPSAVINRTLFEDEFDLQLGKSQWAGFIAEELKKTPKVKLTIDHAYDEQSRQLEVEIDIEVLETITEESVRLSLAITENNLVDWQRTPDGDIDNYVHKHTLREMVTPYDGSLISEELTAGEVISKTFSISLSDDYVAENCSLVAFVNLAGERKDVLQVEQSKIVK